MKKHILILPKTPRASFTNIIVILMFALLFTVNSAAQSQSTTTKLNTDGFMGITYGTSMAKAREIVTDKIGTITMSTSSKMSIHAKPGAIYDLKKYSSDWTSDEIRVVLWFSEDKFTTAALVLPQIPIGKCSLIPRTWCARKAFDKLKDDLETFYGQKAEDVTNAFSESKITYRWEFPVGKTSNYVTMEVDVYFDPEKFIDEKAEFTILFQQGS